MIQVRSLPPTSTSSHTSELRGCILRRMPIERHDLMAHITVLESEKNLSGIYFTKIKVPSVKGLFLSAWNMPSKQPKWY